MWLSDEVLPQEISFDFSHMVNRPSVLRGIGIYCYNSCNNNPKIIEVLIAKMNMQFISIGKYELSLNAGIQVLSIEDIGFNDIYSLKLIIKENYGGERTYINKVFLYENIPKIQGRINIHNSRESNMPYRENEVVKRGRNEHGRNNSNNNSNSNSNSNRNVNNVIMMRSLENIESETEGSNKKQVVISYRNVNVNENENDEMIEQISYNNKIHENSIDIGTNGFNNMNIDHNDSDYNEDNEREKNKYILNNPQFNVDYNINKYNETNDENTNTNANAKYMNINHHQNQLNIDIISQMKSIELNIKEYIGHFHIRVQNIEIEVCNIKQNLNTISNIINELSYEKDNNIQTSNNVNNNIISINRNNKNIVNQNNRKEYQNINITQYPLINSNISSKREKKPSYYLEEQLNKMLEEKFSVFTNKLQNDLNSSLIKPTFEHLERKLESSLIEVKRELLSLQKYKYKTCINNHHYNTNLQHEKKLYKNKSEREFKLDNSIDKLQEDKHKYYNEAENEHIYYTKYKK